jgi:hypothetical protein
MMVRLRIGIAAACALLAAAACDGSNLFSGDFGTGTLPTGTGTVQGSVLAEGTGAGGVSVILVSQDSTVTDLNGVFTFDSIPAATYTLSVRVPIGFTLAAGQTGTRSVSVTTGATSGATFVLQRTTTVP